MADAETTRQRIERLLRDRPLSATELADAAGTTPDAAVTHVRHVARSLDAAEDDVAVAPPRCRSCGFDGFDDPANRPSRCPRCRSEDVADPTFTIR